MSWDPTWEEIFASHEWGKYPPEELIRFVARRFYGAPDRGTVRLLEVGCGAGANIWYLAREGFAVAGIDGARNAVERAGQRLAAEGLEADLRVGDIADLGSHWAPESFDAVIDVGCLTCNRVDAVDGILDGMRRMVRPGGWVYSSVIAAGTLGHGSGQEVEPGTFVGIEEGPLAGRGLIHFFTEEEVEKLYSRFSDVQVDYSERSLDAGPGVYKLWTVTARC